VLARASPSAVAVCAAAWCEDAHRFHVRCAEARNIEVSYLLGMVRCALLAEAGNKISSPGVNPNNNQTINPAFHLPARLGD
jgi:hypothetical protein